MLQEYLACCMPHYLHNRVSFRGGDWDFSIPHPEIYDVAVASTGNTITKYSIIVIIIGLVVNPRRACAARVTVLGLCVCVCVCVCVSVTQHLTFHVFIVPQTILTFSAADEGRKFKAIFSENASLRS